VDGSTTAGNNGIKLKDEPIGGFTLTW